MADDPKNRGQQDRSRVSGSQEHEINYLKEKFPNKSRQEIEAAIKAAGPNREDVEKLLRGK